MCLCRGSGENDCSKDDCREEGQVGELCKVLLSGLLGMNEHHVENRLLLLGSVMLLICGAFRSFGISGSMSILFQSSTVSRSKVGLQLKFLVAGA